MLHIGLQMEWNCMFYDGKEIKKKNPLVSYKLVAIWRFLLKFCWLQSVLCKSF